VLESIAFDSTNTWGGDDALGLSADHLVFALATLIFAVQNLDTVSVSFLSMRVAAPLALLVLIIYVLGAVTGSSLLALLRRSYRGTRV
jgi:putative membrane protein